MKEQEINRDEETVASEKNSEFLLDYNEKIQELLDYIEKAPIPVFKQDEIRQEILKISNTGDLDKLNSLQYEAQKIASDGNVLLKSINRTLDDIKNLQLDSDDNDSLVEDIDLYMKQFRAGKKSATDVIESIRDNFTELEIDLNSDQKEIVTALKDFLSVKSEIIRLSDVLGDKDTLENILETVQSSFKEQLEKLSENDRKSLLDAVKNNEDIVGNKGADYQLNLPDLQDLLASREAKLDNNQKKLILSINNSFSNSDELLKHIAKSLIDESKALRGLAGDYIQKVASGEIQTTYKEFSQRIQAEKVIVDSQTEAGMDTTESSKAIETISETLKSIEKLQKEGSLSRAEKISNDVNDRRQITSLENIEDYLEGLSDQESSILSSFNSNATTVEDMGEDIADDLWDYFSDRYERGRKGSKGKGRGGKGKGFGGKLGRGLGGKLGALAGGIGLGNSAGGLTTGSSSIAGALSGTTSKVLSVGSKVVSKAAVPLTVGLGVYEGYNDYKDATNDNQKTKAVSKATGSTVGAIAGGAIGSLIGPWGTVAGAMLGNWIGGKIGSWVGDSLSDIIDYIPNDIKDLPAKDQLEYLDSRFISDVQTDPKSYGITDKESLDDAMSKLEKYRQELINKVPKETKEKLEQDKPKTDTEAKVENTKTNDIEKAKEKESETPKEKKSSFWSKAIEVTSYFNPLTRGAMLSKKLISDFKDWTKSKSTENTKELPDDKAVKLEDKEKELSSGNMSETELNSLSQNTEDIPGIVKDILQIDSKEIKAKDSSDIEKVKLSGNISNLIEQERSNSMSKNTSESKNESPVIINNNNYTTTVVGANNSGITDPLTNGMR